MRERSSSVSFRFFLGSGLILAVGSTSVWAQLDSPPERVYYRLPIAVDLGDEYLSSFVLELDQIVIDQTLDQFRRVKSTVAEDSLAEFLDHLKAGNSDALTATAIASNDTEMSPSEAGQLLAGAFEQSGARDLELRSVYPLDEHTSLLAWSLVGAGVEGTFVLTLDWDRDAGPITWYPGGAPGPIDDVGALVTRVENALGRGAPVEVDFEPDAYRYSASLGSELARLHFNGKTYRWNVVRDPAPPGSVTAFYKEAFDALLALGPEGMAEYFTEESAGLLREWGASFRPGELERFVADLRRENRHVVFVLDANPFYIVFFNTFSGGPGYDTIWRDPATGELRLTAFRMSDDIDALMRSEEHFWRPIISPLASGGPDPDAQPSMPVVPAYLAGAAAPPTASGTTSAGTATPTSAGRLTSGEEAVETVDTPTPDDMSTPGRLKWTIYLVSILVGALVAAGLLRSKMRR